MISCFIAFFGQFDLGCVLLFNGISIFMGYLMSKPLLLKNNSCSSQLIAGRDKRDHAFPMVLVQKWI